MEVLVPCIPYDVVSPPAVEKIGSGWRDQPLQHRPYRSELGILGKNCVCQFLFTVYNICSEMIVEQIGKESDSGYLSEQPTT